MRRQELTVTAAGKQREIDCRGLFPAEESAYAKFARDAWGQHSRQSDPSFLDWLYKENPNTLGVERDLLVLCDGGQIVGSHHRMRIPWRLNGEAVIVPALHDLFVFESHRGQSGQDNLLPPGLRLMLAALEKEAHVAIFGLNPIADTIYERMRIPKIEVFWLQNVRSRVKAGMQIAASALGWTVRARREASRDVRPSHGHEILRTAAPTDDDLSAALSVSATTATHPDWDLASFRWRFFHKLGPRNILFLARKHGDVLGRAVVSIGMRNGVAVARIVDLVFQDQDCLQGLCAEMDRSFSEIGAPLCLAVTGSTDVAQCLRRAGWEDRNKPIGARWFARRKEARPMDFSISGGAWDFGCDTRIGD
ncbi:MAG: hypothetical protein WAN14_07815 [Candidatus Acidiferrales bacterium]